mgnify:FL=1
MICISLPLIAGIADRAAGTSAALTGPELMTENGCLTEQGSDVFWDRATLYALRGIFYTGNPDKALEILHRLSQRRLLGDHVPYAVEAWPELPKTSVSGKRPLLQGHNGRPLRYPSYWIAQLHDECESSVRLEPDVPEPEAVVPVKPVAREGWDIYTGPNYRYGPSIIINDDNSIDIWLATPGDYYGTNVLVPVSDAITPLQLGTAGVFAQKFTSNEDFGIISLNCPSWNSSAEGFTLKVYKWVNDYETTVSGAAVASKTFVNYADNSWLSIYKSDKEDYTETFPAGTYLWVMTGGTEKSGIWKCPDNGSTGSTGAVSYVDGKPVDGQFRCRITSNGSGNYFWDKITWRHSVDGGKTWTEEADALLPSDGKRDAFSVCDPGVAKWGGWYYIAYTSTEEPNGFDNDLYIARSKTPTGPWEKWSGNGWGQDPQPVIDYEPAAGHESEVFGAGEPCIVVKDDVVYLYYSYNDYLVESNGYCTTTRVSVASSKDENWPGHLEYKGIALDKSDVYMPDHTDVKYICRSQKFVAIHAERRDTDSSRMRVWESNDGIHFTKGGLIEGELRRGIINAGMSGDAQGQVRYGVQQFLCYAHSDATRVWGRWLTWFQPLDWVDVGK